MDQQRPSRAAAFEDEIRPRDGLRVSLGELRTRLDKFDSAPAIESVKAAGSLLEAYGDAVGPQAAETADRRWLAHGEVPRHVLRDALRVLQIAGPVTRLGSIPEDFGPLVTRLMFGSARPGAVPRRARRQPGAGGRGAAVGRPPQAADSSAHGPVVRRPGAMAEPHRRRVDELLRPSTGR